MFLGTLYVGIIRGVDLKCICVFLLTSAWGKKINLWHLKLNL